MGRGIDESNWKSTEKAEEKDGGGAEAEEQLLCLKIYI